MSYDFKMIKSIVTLTLSLAKTSLSSSMNFITFDDLLPSYSMMFLHRIKQSSFIVFKDPLSHSTILHRIQRSSTAFNNPPPSRSTILLHHKYEVPLSHRQRAHSHSLPHPSCYCATRSTTQRKSNISFLHDVESQFFTSKDSTAH